MACLESIPISETDPPNPNFTRDFDSLSLPSLDTDFFSDDFALPDNLMTDLGFDLDFSFDDFILPALGNEDFVAADGSQVLSSSLVSVDTSGFPSSPQEPKVTDKLGVSFSSQVSRNHVASLLNSPSREIGSCNRDSSGAVLSEDSAADCRTAVSGTKVLNSPSPDGGLSGCVPSPNSNSSNIKLDQVRNKRRKEKEDGTTNNPRSSKIRRSILSDDDDANSTTYTTNNTDIEQEAKRKARLMRNRESAQLSRQRKKHYVEELEDKIRSMHSTITELNGKISFIMAENASLRQQLVGGVGGGVCQPPSVIYPPPPMPAMPYHPWLPCASYLMKPQGSQLPLLPIPRLKPRQQPISASKPNKSETKIKKVASVTFLGLLFFILVFGGLVPFVNVKYGGNKETDSSGLQFSNNRFHSHPRGRVLTVTSRFNGSDHNVGVSFNPENSGFGEGDTQSIHGIRGRSKGAKSNVKQNQFGSQPLPALVRPVRLGNGSEPLVAWLYVPRNDKLVKIDGNLIIHSVLASEKAMKSSHATREVKSDRATVSLASEAKENSFAIANNLATTFVVSQAGRNAGRHPHMYRNPNKQQKALTGDTFKEKSKGATADGSHQWFREGLAGPILSSGMCTEVFEFNVSPDSANPGAIIPATAVANISAEHPPDSAQPRKRKNKRILYHSPIPLAGSIVNKTEENDERPSNNIQGNKAVSSMVVSVLVDPRESGDADGAGVISSKSLSRIFVVVLIDSVKYVTYSCVLPHKGSSSHLITT